MIVDRLEKWETYFGSEVAAAFELLSGMTPETPDGEYPLAGKDVFARVMTYDTREPERAQLEAHREYVDVQTVLSGAEGIEWFPVRGLEVKTPYDSEKDVEFYDRPYAGPARVDVSPWLFVALFPWDAHMPQLCVGGVCRRIRKVVVKVRTGLLLP